MSGSYTVTVFECYDYPADMIEWLHSCDSMLVNITGQASWEMLEVSVLGKAAIHVPGRRKPLIVKIADDEIALMFRLKYPNVVATATMIYSTPHTFNI